MSGHRRESIDGAIQSVKTDVPALRARINEIAATRVRYGYPRIHVLLRREGWLVNRKRVYRIYREEGLSMRVKLPRRRKSIVIRDRAKAEAVNQTWSMDFMADNLADGRKIRLLTIVDNFSRECLAIDVGPGFKGTDVAHVLTNIVAERGRPRWIRCDNGPEFVSKALDQWRIGTRSSSTSRGRGSRPTTRSSNLSTGAFGKNC